MIYEYKYTTLSAKNMQEAEDQINAIAVDGWRVVPMNMGEAVLWEREVSEDNHPYNVRGNY